MRQRLGAPAEERLDMLCAFITAERGDIFSVTLPSHCVHRAGNSGFRFLAPVMRKAKWNSGLAEIEELGLGGPRFS